MSRLQHQWLFLWRHPKCLCMEWWGSLINFKYKEIYDNFWNILIQITGLPFTFYWLFSSLCCGQLPPQMSHQMGGVPMIPPQPVMYNQPVLRPTSSFGPIPGTQVSQRHRYIFVQVQQSLLVWCMQTRWKNKPSIAKMCQYSSCFQHMP